jgi:hypothetical protein
MKTASPVQYRSEIYYSTLSSTTDSPGQHDGAVALPCKAGECQMDLKRQHPCPAIMAMTAYEYECGDERAARLKHINGIQRRSTRGRLNFMRQHSKKEPRSLSVLLWR